MSDYLYGSEALVHGAVSSLVFGAASSNSEVHGVSSAGKKRGFAEIQEDRTFLVYAREREGLLPCPYQVATTHGP